MMGRQLKYLVAVRQEDGGYKYVIREAQSKDMAFGAAVQEFGTFKVGSVSVLSTRNVERLRIMRIPPLKTI